MDQFYLTPHPPKQHLSVDIKTCPTMAWINTGKCFFLCAPKSQEDLPVDQGWNASCETGPPAFCAEAACRAAQTSHAQPNQTLGYGPKIETQHLFNFTEGNQLDFKSNIPIGIAGMLYRRVCCMIHQHSKSMMTFHDGILLVRK